MSVFTPKGKWNKPSGYVESQEIVDKWWERNRGKFWNPQSGLYSMDEEPTEEQLKLIEREMEKPSFKQIINGSFKHLESEIKKVLDKVNHEGYVALREVVSVSVTSNIQSETPKQNVPFQNSLAAPTERNGEITVVPDSDTSP